MLSITNYELWMNLSGILLKMWVYYYFNIAVYANILLLK